MEVKRSSKPDQAHAEVQVGKRQKRMQFVSSEYQQGGGIDAS